MQDTPVEKIVRAVELFHEALSEMLNSEVSVHTVTIDQCSGSLSAYFNHPVAALKYTQGEVFYQSKDTQIRVDVASQGPIAVEVSLIRTVKNLVDFPAVQALAPVVS